MLQEDESTVKGLHFFFEERGEVKYIFWHIRGGANAALHELQCVTTAHIKAV